MDRTIDISERFTDRHGREWKLVFDGAAVYAIEKELGIRTLDVSGGMLPALSDQHKTIDMLWTLCRAQAASIGVDVLGFAGGLDDDVIGEARMALFRAYTGFFRNPTRRAALERLGSAIDEIRRRIRAAAELAIRNALTGATGRRSSEQPESRESEPPSGASVCAN